MACKTRALCVTLLLLAGQRASAQEKSFHFDLNTFHTATTSGGLFTVEGTAIGTHLKPRGGVQLGYAHDPLIYEGLEGDDTEAVSSRVHADLWFSMGLFNRAEIGLAVPIVMYQAGDETPLGPSPKQSGIGDLRLVPKVRIYGHTVSGFSVSAISTIRFATSQDDALSGGGWGWEPQAVVGYRLKRLTINGVLGYRLQQTRKLFSLEVDDQFLVAAGARYSFGPFAALAELNLATAADSPFSSTQRTPMQATVGGTYTHSGFTFGLGIGPGLVPGHGAPAVNVLASVVYAPWGSDTDGDGIQDKDDACPLEPEDLDRFADTDGCPDPDNDGDGILDGADRCPNDPEDRDGFKDGDGCPDPDNDGDGILDGKDRCPNQPEDIDKFEDGDGCPDPDNDKDGILDTDDKCPLRAESVNNIADDDGCPEPDKDKDGILDPDDKCPDLPEDKNGIQDDDGCPDDLDNDKIPDDKDRCPDAAENYNGYQDDDGCPDSRKPTALIKKNRIWTSDAIYFASDKWVVQPRFYRILHKVAETINKNRGIRVVYVEGHADGRGYDKYNQWLSYHRANEVVRFLRKKGGVERNRLRPLGWGEQRPSDTESTEKGQARNRCVVFHIVYRKGQEPGGQP